MNLKQLTGRILARFNRIDSEAEMAQKTLPASAMIAALALVQPASHAAGSVSTPWISMADVAQVAAIVSVGAIGAGGTIDVKFEQATDAAGTNAKDLDGSAITQLSQAGDDDSDKQVIVELYGEDLDLKNDFTHVRLTIDIGTAATLLSALVLGLDPRQGKASELNLASVAEIVTL